ncbi:unnamed protein product, partial [Ilex paraguariensis]
SRARTNLGWPLVGTQLFRSCLRKRPILEKTKTKEEVVLLWSKLVAAMKRCLNLEIDLCIKATDVLNWKI